MKHQEMKKTIREYMKELGHNPVKHQSKELPRKNTWPDDVFAKGDLKRPGRRMGNRSGIIVEYKVDDKPLPCLRGVGQLIYYSTLIGIDNVCLVIPEVHLSKLSLSLQRLPWLNVLTVSEDGKVSAIRWTTFPYSMEIFREY